MSVKVSQQELLWREWKLGRERFKGKGPNSLPRPDFGYGGPGQKPVPKAWWTRLEAFLVRADKKEPKSKPVPPISPTMVSQHFNVREFDCKDGTKVPAAAVPAVARLANAFLEPMREKFGRAHVMSGHRHKAYNLSIGGALASQHDYNDDPTTVAADMIFEKGTPQQWAAEARRISDKLGYGGVGEYPPNTRRAGFVHIDNRRYIARWSG